MAFFLTFIRHPVLAAMINLSLVVMGFFSYTRLGVDLMPDVDQPIVTVKVQLEGASPTQIENQITRPVENAVAQVGGIDTITSTSRQGESEVVVTFDVGYDAETMLQESRDRVGAIINDFPQDTKAPEYTRTSSNDSPIIFLTVAGNRTTRELTYMVNETINEALSSVDGVAQIKVSGARNRQVQVVVDPAKLRETGLSVLDVQNALADVGGEIPGGWITSRYSEYLLQIDTDMPHVSAFNDIVLQSTPDLPQGQTPENATDQYATAQVRLGDVATVIDGEEEQRSISRYNGQDTITLKILKNTDANMVAVADAVKAKVKDLEEVLPPDVTIATIHDNSVYVKQSVHDMMQHLVLGSLLASLTVLVFLGSFRLMLIAALAIPVSILSTFILMDVLDYTLNYMTLLALTLAVGLVIDDAVVVLENIWRVVEEEGLAPEEAAVKGMQEIAFAVLATTISLIVLFLPLALMPGIVGEYFRSWGVTLAFAIFMSMMVSFTLTPMLCSRILRPVQRKGDAVPRQTLATRLVQVPYVSLLQVALKVRWLVILLCFVSVVWGLHLLKHIGKDFIASEDEGHYSLNVTLPRGWSIDRISETLIPIEDRLRKLKGVTGVLTTVDDSDITQAEFEVVLVPYEERAPYTQTDSQADANAVIKTYPLLTALSGSPDLQLNVVGQDLDVLENAGKTMVSELSKVKGFQEVQSSLQGAQPDVTVRVDRVRAADLDVDPEDAGNAVRALIGGVKSGTFSQGDQQYDVLVRLPAHLRDVPDRVRALDVPSRNASVGLVHLSEVATITTGLIPSEIDRYNRQRVVTISADLDKGYSEDQGMDEAKKVMEGLNLPPGYGAEQSGNAKLLKETALYAFESFILSVILMYMVLASQFENLLDPILILLTLPLAIPFALFSLQLADMTLNMFSVLGLFLLFGIVKKNAILQVDRTNQLLALEVPMKQAILDANKERLRPILMTTITLVVAMIPPALAGPTGATQAPMAVVIVGGQSMCLLLTLLLVPVASSYVDQLKQIGHWAIWRRLRLHRSGDR